MTKNIIIGFVFFVTEMAWACSTCYGAPDAKATLGMNGAILTLLGVTGGVLSVVVASILSIRNKAKSFIKTHQKFID